MCAIMFFLRIRRICKITGLAAKHGIITFFFFCVFSAPSCFAPPTQYQDKFLMNIIFKKVFI